MQPLKRVPHPSGVSVLFDEKWHQYRVANTKLQSVSKLLDKYFPFEEDKILSLVSRKKQLPKEVIKEQWNRQALLGKNIHEYIECKLLDKAPPTFVLLMEKQRQKAAKGGEETSAKEEGRTMLTEVLHGEEALYLPVADAAVESMKAKYDVLGVEQVVAAVEWGGLAGTIDFIGVRKEDPRRILIGDWKTSGSMSSPFRFGSFEEPSAGCLRHLPNAKFYRYAMQVIIYGEILKRERYIESGFFNHVLTPVLDRITAASTTSRANADDHISAKGKRAKRRSSIPASTAEFLSAFREGSFALEYGIVQLSKNEEGGVEAEFKRVTEQTVLPPDAAEINFPLLLKKVMMGG